MRLEGHNRPPTFRHSLRFRAALGIALPVLLLLIALSWIHYQREKSLLEHQIRVTATQVGEVTLGSLRHVMLEKDEHHLSQILDDVGRMENIQRLFLVDLDGRVKGDSKPGKTQSMLSIYDLGCQECHQTPAEERGRTTLLRTQPTTLRISTPIENDSDCQICHEEPGHLGMLLIDVSLIDLRAQLLGDLTIDLFISLGFTLLITIGVIALMQRLIVARVERLQQPLATMASGDFTVRLPAPQSPRDELDQLTHDVNRMADDLEQYDEEREQMHQARYEAILEERERIAREMHDGVAQLMGYVNTKSNAIRLNLTSNRRERALEQIEQLSLASQEAMLEIRTSILGLRATDQHNEGTRATMASFLSKFNELTGIEIVSDLPESDVEIDLSPERELHVLRITQEALFNIHKHSGAKRAHVSLREVNGQIELRIHDNGSGFQTRKESRRDPFSQGIKNMRERANALGASLTIHTDNHQGTEIVLQIPPEKLS